MRITFDVLDKKGTTNISFDLKRLIVVGYSGSNQEKIMEHIEELKTQLGVAPPKKIPTIFECSLENLTFEHKIKVIGRKTSGEVEFCIIKHSGQIYIGLGSDHTDRDLEGISVLKAKQVCPKPIARNVIPYDVLKDNWSNILLESYQEIDGEKTLYQRGTLAEILPVEKIINELEMRIGNIEDSVIFSGTVPLVSNFKYGTLFVGKLHDSSSNVELKLNYEIDVVEEEEK